MGPRRKHCGRRFALASAARLSQLTGLFAVEPPTDAPSPPVWRRDLLVSVALFVVALLVFWYSPVAYDSDSRYTLLLTESLVSRGSFSLDGYDLPRHPPIRYSGTLLNGRDYQIEIVGDHLFYFFPPGSSILSAPFVLAQDAFHRGVIKRGAYDPNRERGNQHFIASVLMAALAAIFYGTARLLLPVGWSAVIALGGALGTQIYSTASRVLWNHTWGTALLGCVVALLLARETGRLRRLPPVVLATLLSWMYFVRPTNSVYIVAVTVYVLCYHREIFLHYAVTGAAWFAGFVAYSWDHYGAWLPPYFRGSRLQTTTLAEALAGNLIAPSRGLLIYVPVVLFAVYVPLRYWRHRVCPRLLVLAAAAGAFHYVIISCFVPWFGGGCYGPRYTTELVPWFVLATILGVTAARRRHAEAGLPRPPADWRAALAAGGVLLTLSIAINARGAISTATRMWNRHPETVDRQPGRIWDWRYPQILAGWVHPPLPDSPPVLNAGQPVAFGKNQGRRYQLEGWNGSEDEWCWSAGQHAALVFAVPGSAPGTLRVRFASYVHPPEVPRQRVKITLNGQTVGEFNPEDAVMRDYRLAPPAGAWRERNVLAFDLPDST